MWVPHLPEIEKAKNSKYNSSIKAAPDEVWVADRNPPVSRRRLPQTIDASAPAVTRAEILQRAQEAKDAYQSINNRFQVGDRVRIKMTELFAHQRKVVKQGSSKQLAVLWSPVIYSIQERRGSRVGHTHFILVNDQGDRIMDYRRRTRLFKADSLLPAGDLESGDLSFDRALKLYGIERSRSDAINL
jgi:hypothetical protein